MAQPVEVINEVLGLLEPMVAPDGGSLRVGEFSPEQSRLTVDYSRGVNDVCATCVIDGDSLRAFIEEGLQIRGLHLSEVTVNESPATLG